MAEAKKAGNPQTETGAGVAEVSAPLSLADLFGQEMEQEEVAPRMVMPPSYAPVKRRDRGTPIPSLTGLAPFWMLFGRGNTGKTLFARIIAGELLERKTSRFILAPMDPGPRLLAEFSVKTMQPPSTDAGETAEWLRDMLGRIMKHRAPGVGDTGGGETAVTSVIRAAPTLAREMEDAGVALIPAYFFAAPDDPAILEMHAAMGFTPRATALILNMNNVDSGTGYRAVQSHPAYKAALDRGAVEIVIPRLEPLALSQRMESRRFLPFQARDGIVPEGNPYAPLESGMDRAIIREWMESYRRELEAVEAAGWMPWS